MEVENLQKSDQRARLQIAFLVPEVVVDHGGRVEGHSGKIKARGGEPEHDGVDEETPYDDPQEAIASPLSSDDKSHSLLSANQDGVHGHRTTNARDDGSRTERRSGDRCETPPYAQLVGQALSDQLFPPPLLWEILAWLVERSDMGCGDTSVRCEHHEERLRKGSYQIAFYYI